MNKKFFWIIAGVVLVAGLLLAYFLRPMTMDDLSDKPNFVGTVTEVKENAILVLVDEGEDELASSDLMWVSLKTKLKDSTTTFSVGDRVKVFYGGDIAESYPAQINAVYAILFTE